MKLGYLVSQYPAVNHTYILREVLSLRRQGVDVWPVSVRRCDRPRSSLSPDEAAEERRTFSVLGAGLGQALMANMRVLIRRPIRYLRGLIFAWGLTRGTPKLVVSYTCYFFEAVVAGDYFNARGITEVHTHFASTVLLILARVFPIRYSLTVHGSGEFVDVVGFHMAEKVAGARFIVTISLYGSSQVMNASDPAHWHKVIVLPLGVDTEIYAPKPLRVRSPDAPFRLVSVGHLSPAKGYPILIEAVSLLRAQGRNVHLTIVGDGAVRSLLEALIRKLDLGEHVSLVGACNHDRVVDYLRESDALALSSFLEGVPVVLMEAMAMELPCIATLITGIPEIIEAEVDGILVPAASSRCLAEAIGRLIDDPEFAKRIGMAGRRKILSKYELGRNVQRLCEVFRQHLGRQVELVSSNPVT